MTKARKQQTQWPRVNRRRSQHNKLAIFVGKWNYAGIRYDSKLGPGGKFSGEQTSQLVLDGNLLETIANDSGTYGGKSISYHCMSFRWFDADADEYRCVLFDNYGFVSQQTVSRMVRVWIQKGTVKDRLGKIHQVRSETKLSENGSRFSQRGDISFDDGRTWSLFWEQANIRTIPATANI